MMEANPIQRNTKFLLLASNKSLIFLCNKEHVATTADQ